MNKYRVFRTVTKILMAQFLWITLAAIGNAENISLQKPAVEDTSFLEVEAGISAYTNVGQTIDLSKARSAFRTIEKETEEYIIGSVPLPDYEETEDVHAYVHQTGWIVAYYLSDEPAGKIVDWNNYGEDEKIKGTKLESGISVLCNASQVPIKNVKYYDFRYPEANKLMIIADAHWNSEPRVPDTFSLKLPTDFLVYESSFSHCGVWGGSNMYIDEKEISYSSGGRKTNYGLLSPMQLSAGDFHTIKMIGSSSRYDYGSFVSIVLVYREP